MNNVQRFLTLGNSTRAGSHGLDPGTDPLLAFRTRATDGTLLTAVLPDGTRAIPLDAPEVNVAAPRPKGRNPCGRAAPGALNLSLLRGIFGHIGHYVGSALGSS